MSATKSSNDVFERTNIKIPSVRQGWSLDAWKYLPKVARKDHPTSGLPIIVMAHGLSANKLMGLAPYAETFATLGYAVVVFDYRRWGASDGTPRHVVYVSEQLEDYRTVIKYCRQQPEFDPHRVIAWGTSFSGGHVVTLASEQQLNLSAAIAQCPYLGAGPKAKLSWPFIKIMGKCVLDVVKQTLGLHPIYIPAVGHPGEVACLTTPGTVPGMLSLAKAKEDYPNEISASSLFELPMYNPNASAARIGCPVLVVLPEHDNICLPEAGLELKGLSPRVELVTLPVGHFDVYPGLSAHERSLDAMKAFLTTHVPPT